MKHSGKLSESSCAWPLVKRDTILGWSLEPSVLTITAFWGARNQLLTVVACLSSLSKCLSSPHAEGEAWHRFSMLSGSDTVVQGVPAYCSRSPGNAFSLPHCPLEPLCLMFGCQPPPERSWGKWNREALLVPGQGHVPKSLGTPERHVILHFLSTCQGSTLCAAL